MVIETSRLVLREYKMSDLDRLVAESACCGQGCSIRQNVPEAALTASRLSCKRTPGRSSFLVLHGIRGIVPKGTARCR